MYNGRKLKNDTFSDVIEEIATNLTFFQLKAVKFRGILWGTTANIEIFWFVGSKTAENSPKITFFNLHPFYKNHPLCAVCVG